MPSKQEICFVTHNNNKLREILQLAPEGFPIYGLDELGLHEEIPETGDTIEENARIKAQYVYDRFQVPCFADDTGLEVEALNGAPGVYSARYAGEEKDASKNMDLVLKNLADTKNRKARFKTVICFIDQDGQVRDFEGIVEGEILKEAKGVEGFGYDPIFLPDGYRQTFAEMNLSEKNRISHRSISFQKLFTYLSTQSG